MSVVLSGQKYLSFHLYLIDTFQDILIAEHMKPCMHILEISYLIQLDVRPTETPKSADKNFAQFYHLKGFKYHKMSITTNVPLN